MYNVRSKMWSNIKITLSMGFFFVSWKMMKRFLTQVCHVSYIIMFFRFLFSIILFSLNISQISHNRTCCNSAFEEFPIKWRLCVVNDHIECSQCIPTFQDRCCLSLSPWWVKRWWNFIYWFCIKYRRLKSNSTILNRMNNIGCNTSDLFYFGK